MINSTENKIYFTKESTLMKLYSITYSSKGVKVFTITVKEIYKELKNFDT